VWNLFDEAESRDSYGAAAVIRGLIHVCHCRRTRDRNEWVYIEI
jgi:hypothetical protein